jgi:hypothetical protein
MTLRPTSTGANLGNMSWSFTSCGAFHEEVPSLVCTLQSGSGFLIEIAYIESCCVHPMARKALGEASKAGSRSAHSAFFHPIHDTVDECDRRPSQALYQRSTKYTTIPEECPRFSQGPNANVSDCQTDDVWPACSAPTFLLLE